MSFVVTLAGFRPPPRFDDIAWTVARIQESASSTGPWSTVEEIDPLVPADADPEAPQIRNLTTDAATVELGWYRVQWADVGGNVDNSDPVARIPSGGITVSEVRASSLLIREEFPDDPFDADVERRLEQHVTTANALVEELTCRSISDLSGNLRWIAVRAVTLKAEQLAVRASSKTRRKSITGGNLRSISAGPWSESYFGPDEASKAKVLDPDPALHEALWALTTEECREKWLLLWGVKIPSTQASVTAWDFRRLPGGY